jgi:Fe-S-cluster containining protein
VEDTNIRSYLKEHAMEYKSQCITPADILKAVVSGDYSGVTCPYVENDRCMIYPVRPLICRLQGLAEKLPCPYIKPEKILTKDQIDKLFAELIKRKKNAHRSTEASAC